MDRGYAGYTFNRGRTEAQDTAVTGGESKGRYTVERGHTVLLYPVCSIFDLKDAAGFAVPKVRRLADRYSLIAVAPLFHNVGNGRLVAVRPR